MSISRRIARPLLASMFVSGGLDAIQSPESKVKAAEAVTEPLKARFPALPQDTATLVRLNGFVQVGAGGLLAIGKFRRLAAWALVASVLPTTYAGHRFWEEIDEEARAQQRVHFLKNLGLLGGLILAATDTEGAPSLGWRAHRRADQLTLALGSGRAATSSPVHRSSAKVSEAGRRARRQAARTGRKGVNASQEATAQAKRTARRAGRNAAATAHEAGRRASRANESVTEAARSGVSLATPYMRHVSESAHGAAKTAQPYLSAGVEKASELLAKASEHLPT
jgi:putative oxidoreductase